jgi:hypothetical protein
VFGLALAAMGDLRSMRSMLTMMITMASLMVVMGMQPVHFVGMEKPGKLIVAWDCGGIVRCEGSIGVGGSMAGRGCRDLRG